MANKKRQKRAQGNPGQPAGWAQGNPVNPNAYPGGELQGLVQQQRSDTAQWEDAQNRSPMDNINPAQPPGFAVPAPTMGPIPGQGADAIMARVSVPKTANTVRGGLVTLAGANQVYSGQVINANDDSFWVAWSDGSETIEKKANFDLIIVDDENAPRTAKKVAIQIADHNINLNEYLAGADPDCDTCGDPWALHGHDDGSCTVGAAWYDGRGAEALPDACQCQEFKNAKYENWYCQHCKGAKTAEECAATRRRMSTVRR